MHSSSSEPPSPLLLALQLRGAPVGLHGAAGGRGAPAPPAPPAASPLRWIILPLCKDRCLQDINFLLSSIVLSCKDLWWLNLFLSSPFYTVYTMPLPYGWSIVFILQFATMVNGGLRAPFLNMCAIVLFCMSKVQLRSNSIYLLIFQDGGSRFLISLLMGLSSQTGIAYLQLDPYPFCEIVFPPLVDSFLVFLAWWLPRRFHGGRRSSESELEEEGECTESATGTAAAHRPVRRRRPASPVGSCPTPGSPATPCATQAPTTVYCSPASPVDTVPNPAAGLLYPAAWTGDQRQPWSAAARVQPRRRAVPQHDLVTKGGKRLDKREGVQLQICNTCSAAQTR
jgi:hypothetical protein